MLMSEDSFEDVDVDTHMDGNREWFFLFLKHTQAKGSKVGGGFCV